MNASGIPNISYDPSATFIPTTGISKEWLKWLKPQLLAARNEVLDDLTLWKSKGPIPDEKQPLDAGFIDLPERLLHDYRERGNSSQVGRILATADRLANRVDKVVVLGIGGSYMGARAVFEACCHPYHNELDREARKGRPRIYFGGNNVDNDATAGLVDMLGRDDGKFGIVVISKSGGTLETAVAFRLFLDKLSQAFDGDLNKLYELVVPVTGDNSRLFNLATALGCQETFPIPDGVGGRFSVFTAVGLLPAAVLGLDIVKLLEGAAVANQQFCNSDPSHNPVLDYVGVCHLLETRRDIHTRILSTWGSRMEAIGLWYDQLLAESLGKDGQGALPLTVVNTRDLHSRGQQHQEGRRDKVVTNLIVDKPSCAPVTIQTSSLNQDLLNDMAGKSLVDIMSAAVNGTNRAYADDHRPTADLHLPKLDEASIGQIFQMLMLATVVEGRLIGINPYGQPGVEAYKRHMTH
ncbi:MAG: glucose-6-phosphate isomerase, partial [Planctomycetia bacterium]